MSWLSFLTSLLNLLLWIARYVHEQKLIDQGEMAAFNRILKGQADDLDKKLRAMADAGRRFDDAGGMPSDGRFRD